jgi:limonene-1,2-epoxide hydrolase
MTAVTDNSTTAARDAVLGLWQALSRRDWDAVKTFLSDDCIYVDMPVGPTLAARGPDDIVKRLKVGLEPLAGYQNHDGVLVSNGSDAMYEHSETWTFKTGEEGVLRFVTVHKVVPQNGQAKIAVWKDYWDMAGLTSFAPPTWMEDLATADTSWVFDATGLV